MPLQPRPHQLPLVTEYSSLLATGEVCIDASETGVGKTYVAAMVAERLGHGLLVVCPKSVQASWRRVAGMAGVACEVLTYEKARSGSSPLVARHRFGRKSFKFSWKIPRKTLVVFDEAHRIGGEKTLNSLLAVGAFEQRYPIMLLSATLFDTPLRAWAVGYLLRLHRIDDFPLWCRHHGCRKGFFGGLDFIGDRTDEADENGKTIYSKAATMERIRQSMGPRFKRILKKDVPGFPVNQVEVLMVDPDTTPEVKSRISQMKKDRKTELEDGGSAMTAALRDFQIAEMTKVGAMAELAEDLNSQGKAVVLFVNFRPSLEALLNALGADRCAVIRGDQDAEDRESERLRFQTNQVPFILVMIQAGGAGLELHDLKGVPRATVISPGYQSLDLVQAIGRTHRDGGSDVIQYILFNERSDVETRIAERVRSKLENLSTLNDSDLNFLNMDPTEIDIEYVDAPPLTPAVVPPVTKPAPEPAPEATSVEPAPEPPAEAAPEVKPKRKRRTKAEMEAFRAEQAKLKGEVAEPTATPELATTPEQTPAPEAINLMESAPRKHALCSPSKLKNLEICPSWKSDETTPTNPITEQGTRLHGVLEMMVGSYVGLGGELDFSDREVTAQEYPGLSEEELGLVTLCFGLVKADLDQAVGIWMEERIETHEPEVWGYYDLLIRLPGAKLKFVDWKFVFNPVDDAETNIQGWAYVVGAFESFPEIDEIEFWFVQPRIGALSAHTFYRDDLDAMKKRISAIVSEVKKGGIYAPHPTGCDFCGAKAACPALTTKALQVGTHYKKDDLEVPEEYHPSKITDPSVMSKALKLARVLEKWCDSVKHAAHVMRFDEGKNIPGYTVASKAGKRRIVDPTIAYGIASAYGVTVEEYIGCTTISVADLIEAVRTHNPEGVTKKEYAEKFDDALKDAGCITRDQESLYLAPIKNKPSVNPITTESVSSYQIPAATQETT